MSKREKWEYLKNNNTDSAHHVIDAHSGEVVLTVPFDLVIADDSDASFDAAMSRAILASAAPELLAACKVALVMLQVVGADHMAGVKQIEAAIAKATGDPQ